MTCKRESIASVKISDDMIERARAYVRKKKRGHGDLTQEERALIYRYQVECKGGEYISSRDLAKIIGVGHNTILNAVRELRDAKD